MFLPSNITLKFGDSGDFVAELQRRLASVGAHADHAINGSYDGITVNSVSGFQSRSGLRADGIAGPETLRKLNGVVSGDSSSSTSSGSNEEEKQQQAASEFMMRASMLEPAAQETPMFGVRTEEAAPRVEAAAVAHEVVPQQYAPQTAPQPALTEQQLLQQNIQREIMINNMQQQQPAIDPLAAMLLQQTAQARSVEQQPQQQERQPLERQPLQAAHTQQPHAAQPVLQPEGQGQAPAAREAGVPAAPGAEPQAKGIVGRAMQKMDGMLQKLSSYFEAKLPPDVMQEVKQLGNVMLQSGVKEVPIPAGPEQTRTPTAPARGPDQQQIPTRG